MWYQVIQECSSLQPLVATRRTRTSWICNTKKLKYAESLQFNWLADKYICFTSKKIRISKLLLFAEGTQVHPKVHIMWSFFQSYYQLQQSNLKLILHSLFPKIAISLLIFPSYKSKKKDVRDIQEFFDKLTT